VSGRKITNKVHYRARNMDHGNDIIQNDYYSAIHVDFSQKCSAFVQYICAHESEFIIFDLALYMRETVTVSSRPFIVYRPTA